ncbi:hypothetical protein GR157_05040 [Burkholderia sp. 4701]|nr:hypothetical protein [Burkholderia sp. 4701]MXN80393.1 hypothetical protein [Burkholderia sp. 4812]
MLEVLAPPPCGSGDSGAILDSFEIRMRDAGRSKRTRAGGHGPALGEPRAPQSRGGGSFHGRSTINGL